MTRFVGVEPLLIDERIRHFPVAKTPTGNIEAPNDDGINLNIYKYLGEILLVSYISNTNFQVIGAYKRRFPKNRKIHYQRHRLKLDSYLKKNFT